MKKIGTTAIGIVLTAMLGLVTTSCCHDCNNCSVKAEKELAEQQYTLDQATADLNEATGDIDKLNAITSKIAKAVKRSQDHGRLDEVNQWRLKADEAALKVLEAQQK